MASYIRLYQDSESLGCGFRNYIVIKAGQKWSVLFYAPRLKTVKVPSADLRRAEPIDYDRRHLARIIRANKRDRAALGLPWSKSGTKAALDLLR